VVVSFLQLYASAEYSLLVRSPKKTHNLLYCTRTWWLLDSCSSHAAAANPGSS
jgi:hypothetical protein